uniref:IKBKB interacting protein n=1 Tax=Canis lupus familiaris TaxID=9615 RepID=A0A8C0QFW1_CANLF
MSEVKSRKKSGPKGAPSEPGTRSEGGKSPEARGGGGGWADPRTGVSLLSLGTCLGLACGRSLKLSWNSGSLFK